MLFNETRVQTNSSRPLTFIRSLNINVYPCGRRRSQAIDFDNNNDTKDDKYYIPFDPEARLNTEFNNRRYSSTNGFTQSYINKWDTEKGLFSFTISGYGFTIDLTKSLKPDEYDYNNINNFGKKIAENLAACVSNPNNFECTKIYANIKLEEIPLYASVDTTYNTWVLRNQSATELAEVVLDFRKTNIENYNDSTDYYFSGLSFSAEPITGKIKDPATNKYFTYSDTFIEKGAFATNASGDPDPVRSQHDFSLCILSKDEISGEWQLYEPAKLPYIEHGDIENSLNVGHLNAESIRFRNKPVAVFDINEVEVNGTSFYQLHLYDADLTNNPETL